MIIEMVSFRRMIEMVLPAYCHFQRTVFASKKNSVVLVDSMMCSIFEALA